MVWLDERAPGPAESCTERVAHDVGFLFGACAQAIDLVDESAAKLKMEITSKPTHLDEIDRKILQLEMERLSLAKARHG